MNRSKAAITIALSLLVTFSGASVSARSEFGNGRDGRSRLSTQALSHCIATHRVGKIQLAINNNGTIGNGFAIGSVGDCFSNLSVPSCEYPKGSHIDYLFAGAFWIGAVVGRDTLVSVGADGWSSVRELYPDISPFGDMLKRSIIDPKKPEFEGAISEEDFISVYSDTFTSGVGALGARHIPLHIEISDNSYAWSYSYAEDIILFDYKIKNIGIQTLNDVYMGVYVDGDVCADCGNGGFSDDITGFLQTIPATFSDCEYIDTVNVAWLADGDGDLTAPGPAPDVTATRIVRTPAESLAVSYNWWISSGSSDIDFGPREHGEVGKLKEKFRDFDTGGLGTPEGDENKYYIMRNQEFDYDQARIASIQPTDSLWLYPNQNNVSEWAKGLDTRYLLSFGPFDIAPGQSLPVSIAYLGGEDLHSVFGNADNLPENPTAFYANLDFSDLGTNATWAGWIYDNPGVDTDGDGYAGKYRVCVLETIIDTITAGDTTWLPVLADTQWYEGDGVPDFRGASPPPAPDFWLTSEENSIRVRFNGANSETIKDVFSGVKDFEGYRVYFGRDERSTSFSTITSYDVEDYNKWIWDTARNLWDLKEAPFSPGQLRCLYGSSCDDMNFVPEHFTRLRPYTHPQYPESLFFFQPQDFNESELGQPGKIRKLYADQPYPSTLILADARPEELTEDGYFKFFEYEYVIENLLPTVPYWINVTAFDFGSPQSGLPSLETSVTVGTKNAYPNSSSVSSGNSGKIVVWPNPYRIDADYRELGFEGRTDSDRPNDRVRRVHFGNLPAKCTIRIFTIDGDLVNEIDHDIPASDPNSSHESWNLITRNTQLVVSGIYYWTVESSDLKTQIGKLVVIM